jgi:SAM-dependent methyltransferase
MWAHRRARVGFKDHFSRQSAAYSRYRPSYPDELIAYVAAQAPRRGWALDCATGNGQAALALAGHFGAVLAVDGSVSQLARAQPHPRVHYAAALAERLPARDGSLDLVAAGVGDSGRHPHNRCRGPGSAQERSRCVPSESP